MIPRAVSPARASTCAVGVPDDRLALLLARGIVVVRTTVVTTSSAATLQPWPDIRAQSGWVAQRGSARTGRPGRASATMSPSRTTKLPLTRTCRMPVDGRVLSL
jgi:hypothetical protein